MDRYKIIFEDKVVEVVAPNFFNALLVCGFDHDRLQTVHKTGLWIITGKLAVFPCGRAGIKDTHAVMVEKL